MHTAVASDQTTAAAASTMCGRVRKIHMNMIHQNCSQLPLGFTLVVDAEAKSPQRSSPPPAGAGAAAGGGAGFEFEEGAVVAGAMETLLKSPSRSPIPAPEEGLCTGVRLAAEGTEGGSLTPPGGGGRKPPPRPAPLFPLGRLLVAAVEFSGLSGFGMFILMVCPSLKAKSSLGLCGSSSASLLSPCSRLSSLKWSCRATFRSKESARSAKPIPM